MITKFKPGDRVVIIKTVVKTMVGEFATVKKVMGTNPDPRYNSYRVVPDNPFKLPAFRRELGYRDMSEHRLELAPAMTPLHVEIRAYCRRELGR